MTISQPRIKVNAPDIQEAELLGILGDAKFTVQPSQLNNAGLRQQLAESFARLSEEPLGGVEVSTFRALAEVAKERTGVEIPKTLSKDNCEIFVASATRVLDSILRTAERTGTGKESGLGAGLSLPDSPTL